jgi:hypothetical protein
LLSQGCQLLTQTQWSLVWAEQSSFSHRFFERRSLQA